MKAAKTAALGVAMLALAGADGARASGDSGAQEPRLGDDVRGAEAGSGPVPARPAPGLRPPDAPPLSAEEEEALDRFEEAYERYRRAADAHHDRIADILRREYEMRRERLRSHYDGRLEVADEARRDKHASAIEELEAFIETHPDHDEYTPDAMFRLANLYLDRAEFEFEDAFEAGDFAGPGDAAGAEDADPDDAASEDTDGAADPDDEGPALAGPDYSDAIEMWRETITRFPDYRQKAGTLYLLGYYLGQVGRDRESLVVYRGLVCPDRFDPNDAPPPEPTREEIQAIMAEGAEDFEDPYQGCEGLGDDPDLIEEGWVRGVGDVHFNTPGELREAISAYAKVAGDRDSEFYDEALYKLAWSHYRNDDFLDGIAAFDEAVMYSDELEEQGEDPLELRPEALQYIAVSFTDPWEVGEEPDPDRSLRRALEFYGDRLGEPHVRDVLAQLGDTFQVLQAHEQAIEAFRLALEHYPLDPDSPVVHQEIVNSLEAMGETEAADREAARLTRAYARGTEWYAENETDREAMENLRRIGERMLRAAAENRHREAQLARREHELDPEEGSVEDYRALYREAAELYEQFLDEYPTADEAYEFTYRLGETRFFAGDYLEAAEHYRWVRDRRALSEARFEDAAISLVQAYERAIRVRAEEGRLPAPDPPTVEDLRAMESPEPLSIPELYRRQQAAVDEYLELVGDSERAPRIALHGALIPYRFLHLEEAEARFDAVLDAYCGRDAAARAKDGLLAIYEARGDGARFEEVTRRFIEDECGDDEAMQIAQAQSRSRRFRDAEELFREERYESAGEAFYRFYREAPRDDEDRPVALYNAAIAYDRAGMPTTAVHLFEEFTESDEDRLQDSEYYLEALYLSALSHQRGFDYDRATETYLEVVELATAGDRPEPPGERTLEEIRLDALYNAAVLRELDEVYTDPPGAPGTGAASLYERYADHEDDRRESDRALWAAARAYAEAGQPQSAAQAYERWRDAFGRDEGNEDDYVYSYYRTAELFADAGRRGPADRYRRDTIDAWERVGEPQGGAAADRAAEMAFHFAEREYERRFVPHSIDHVPASEAQAERVLDQHDALTDEIRDNFERIGRFGAPEWGMAAGVRVGDTLFESGQKILQAPPPAELERLDRQHPEEGVLIQYEQALESGLVEPLERAAREEWESVVQAADRAGVSNEWSERAQQRLHDYISQEDYSMLRPPIVEGTEEP